MFLYRPHWSDIFRMVLSFFKRPEPRDVTYVVTQHYVNGDPPREVCRTTSHCAAQEMAQMARRDFDPFLREVTIDEERVA